MPSTVAPTTRERITNFSRRFTYSNFSQRKLPPDLRKGYQAEPVQPQPYPSTNGDAHHSYNTSAGISPGTAYTTSGSASSSLSSTYQLRPPTLHRKHSSLLAASPSFVLPDLPWLCGTWHVTHSTLPMWRNKRNVRISYTRLAGNRLDDVVTYQNKDGDKVQQVRGVDTPRRDGSWLWRGKGMLMVASSKWEVLGWGGGGARDKKGRLVGEGEGEGQDSNAGPEKEADNEQWVVTFFAKTVFTPAGIDIYSRRQTGLSPHTLKQLRRALMQADGSSSRSKGAQQTEFGKLVSEIFEVKIDTAARDDLIEN